jgi:hypothetical protein
MQPISWPNTWGAQAWCFPRRALEALVAAPEFEHMSCENALLDRLICGVLGKSRLACFQHIPSLAKHIGHVSTLKHVDNPGKEAVGFNLAFRVASLKSKP